MAIAESRVRNAVRRLHLANSRILEKHPFYAVLLLQMKYSLDENCETAYTDGSRIAFCPDFLDSLEDSELDFVLMHEVLHVVLEHCGRTKREFIPELFNIACDIVVNSNILLSNDMDVRTITLHNYGESMHKLPDGSEGFKYTAEEVYKRLSENVKESKQNSSGNKKDNEGSEDKERNNTRNENGKDNKDKEGKEDKADTNDNGRDQNDSFDDHGKWIQTDGDNESEIEENLNAAILNAYEALKSLGKLSGNIPAGIERKLNELVRPQTDWRTVLADFVQTEVNDYSFIPPDRRMQDMDFFMPDFNEKTDSVENILFMIDTSGSMSDETITACYSEIKGALEQFDKLEGLLGFFDASVVPPVEFSSVEDLRSIKPVGGGGTSFRIIFDYIRDNIQDNLPVAVVILTDGEADFPEEKEALGIPVLWVLTTDKEIPWGKVTRIKET